MIKLKTPIFLLLLVFALVVGLLYYVEAAPLHVILKVSGIIFGVIVLKVLLKGVAAYLAVKIQGIREIEVGQDLRELSGQDFTDALEAVLCKKLSITRDQVNEMLGEHLRIPHSEIESAVSLLEIDYKLPAPSDEVDGRWTTTEIVNAVVEARSR